MEAIIGAVYLDVGGGLDGIAGILDPDRPYAKGWINNRLRNYNHSNLDLLRNLFKRKSSAKKGIKHTLAI